MAAAGAGVAAGALKALSEVTLPDVSVNRWLYSWVPS